MPKLVEVRCPACGAPLRIDPRAPLALCTHCRVQSRVQRVTSAHALSGPGEEGVIRVRSSAAHTAGKSATDRPNAVAIACAR